MACENSTALRAAILGFAIVGLSSSRLTGSSRFVAVLSFILFRPATPVTHGGLLVIRQSDENIEQIFRGSL
jgi:hypothetical protein